MGNGRCHIKMEDVVVATLPACLPSLKFRDGRNQADAATDYKIYIIILKWNGLNEDELMTFTRST